VSVLKKSPGAWQPLTPRGVGAFATAPAWRVFLVQCVFAVIAAATVIWFLQRNWFPVVRLAIRHLPPAGEIRRAKLSWQGDSPARLAENRCLALSVDTNHAALARTPAHIQVEFGQNDVRVISLFGFASAKYPADWRIAFNRDDLEPWWGAWTPVLLAFAAVGVFLYLFITWALLATVYVLPAWLIAFFADRQLTLAGSWRLASASLMPGALVMISGILCYGLGLLDPIQLLLLTALHFVVGWLYLVLSTLALERTEDISARKNPFTGAESGAPAGDKKDETEKH